MKTIVEIITIGREILDGRVIDTNAVFLGEELSFHGLSPSFRQQVDDDIDNICEAFRIARTRSHIILVTGGLGPTSDDITAESFARFLNKPLKQNQEALDQVISFFKQRNVSILDSQFKQSFLPEGCKAIPNQKGSAPGFYYENSNSNINKNCNTSSNCKDFFWAFMPGVPKEMKCMFSKHILSKLPTNKTMKNYFWMTHFTSEGELQQQLSNIIDNLPSNFELSFRTRRPENHIGLHAACFNLKDDEVQFAKQFEHICNQITCLIGKDCFATGSRRELEEIVIEQLIKHNCCIGTMELGTAGLISNRLTNIPRGFEVLVNSDPLFQIKVNVDGGHNDHTELHSTESPVEQQCEQIKQETIMLAKQGLSRIETINKNSNFSSIPNAIYVVTSPIFSLFKNKSVITSMNLTHENITENQFCYIAIAKTGQSINVEKFLASPNLQLIEYKQIFSQRALELVRTLIK